MQSWNRSMERSPSPSSSSDLRAMDTCVEPFVWTHVWNHLCTFQHFGASGRPETCLGPDGERECDRGGEAAAAWRRNPREFIYVFVVTEWCLYMSAYCALFVRNILAVRQEIYYRCAPNGRTAPFAPGYRLRGTGSPWCARNGGQVSTFHLQRCTYEGGRSPERSRHTVNVERSVRPERRYAVHTSSKWLSHSSKATKSWHELHYALRAAKT